MLEAVADRKGRIKCGLDILWWKPAPYVNICGPVLDLDWKSGVRKNTPIKLKTYLVPLPSRQPWANPLQSLLHSFCMFWLSPFHSKRPSHGQSMPIQHHSTRLNTCLFINYNFVPTSSMPLWGSGMVARCSTKMHEGAYLIGM